MQLSTRNQVYQAATNLCQGILAGFACLFPIAALSVAFGFPGILIGSILSILVGWLYHKASSGEETGVRWFAPVVFAMMAAPYFAVVTSYSLAITLLLTIAMIWGFDTLKRYSEVFALRKAS